VIALSRAEQSRAESSELEFVRESSFFIQFSREEILRSAFVTVEEKTVVVLQGM
jgi:hypothetical protein